MTRPPPARDIALRGVRVHNLKNADLDIPRNRLTVVTGVSGSGKSSLVFDTLYVEGQRRYIESFPPDARRLLVRHDRPDAERIDHVPPAIALRQDAGRRFGPRATLATVTEIHDGLRTLFARHGTIVCPRCAVVVRRDEPADVLESIRLRSEGTRWQVAFSIATPTSDHTDEQSAVDDDQHAEASLREAGFTRILKRADEWLVVVDRLVVGRSEEGRGLEAIESAFLHGDGGCVVLIETKEGAAGEIEDDARRDVAGARWTIDGRDYSVERRHQGLVCGACGTTYPEPEPRLFSFHSPLGACRTCQGTGAITGTSRRSREQSVAVPCSDCGGDRLQPAALAVRLLEGPTTGPNIADLCRNSAVELTSFLATFAAGLGDAGTATRPLFDELSERLARVIDLGLGDLPLDRAAKSLSSGEGRRAALAGTLGAALTQALYVLDEPAAGLHPLDIPGVLRAVRRLRDAGNTVVVVEHGESFLDAADRVVEIGPGAGIDGGRVTFDGPPTQLRTAADSVTGPWLTGERRPRPALRRDPDERPRLVVSGCRGNNLQDVSVEIPLGALCVMTGVSGAGKSSLLRSLSEAAAHVTGRAIESAPDAALCKTARLLPAARQPAAAAPFEEAILVDQSPLPGSYRSTPATCVKAFDLIRRLFAQTPEAQVRNYGPAHFGFHAAGGRCPKCEGAGRLTIDMQFLPDVTTTCPECDGTRFQKEILDVRCRGLNIAETLSLSVRDAWAVFSRQPKLLRRLQPLRDVGLDYLPLGQPVATLSGGERQRLKLAMRLATNRRTRTLFLLDEPTTGLHRSDVSTLLVCFDNLLAVGHSLAVVENHADVVAAADWIIELGPGGGRGGGRVVAQGAPETVVAAPSSCVVS